MHIGLEAIRTWRRRRTAAAAPEPPRIIPRLERVAPQVPVPYLGLYKYLEHRYASVVVLSFAQIDALLGFALPAAARTEPEWWTVGSGMPKAHCSAWTEAHRTAVPNLLAGNIVFERHN